MEQIKAAKDIEPSKQVNKTVTPKNDGNQAMVQFADQRPEALSLLKTKEFVNDSSQANRITQLQALANNETANHSPVLQKKPNKTGLPDNLKSGVEHLSGISLDDVRVHRNSNAPAQLNAHAYAQGSNIHLGPGQEKHLPHEAWHVVQQKQGRVQATRQMKGKVNINDDAGLEQEADVMGAKAINLAESNNLGFSEKVQHLHGGNNNPVPHQLVGKGVLQLRKIKGEEKEFSDDEIADKIIASLGIDESLKEEVIALIGRAYPDERAIDKMTQLEAFVHFELTKEEMSNRAKFEMAGQFTSFEGISSEIASAAIRMEFGEDLSEDNIYPWLLNEGGKWDTNKLRLWGYIKGDVITGKWQALKKWLQQRVRNQKAALEKEHALMLERQMEKEIAMMRSLNDKTVLGDKRELAGNLGALPDELLFKIFGFLEGLIPNRHAPKDYNMLVPEFSENLIRLRQVNKFFRLFIDRHHNRESIGYIGQGIRDARSKRAVLPVYFSSINSIVEELLDTYPPEESCFFSLGGSPTPIAIALEKYPGHVKANVFHLPLGNIKGSVDGWERQADMNWEPLKKYIARFVPDESDLGGKQVVVFDYVSRGIAINTVTRILRKYYPSTKVLGAGLTGRQSSPTFDKGVVGHELSRSLGRAMEDKTFKKANLRTTASVTLKSVLESEDGMVEVAVDYGALMKMLGDFTKYYKSK